VHDLAFASRKAVVVRKGEREGSVAPLVSFPVSSWRIIARVGTFS
jgi:hypothetical protein